MYPLCSHQQSGSSGKKEKVLIRNEQRQLLDSSHFSVCLLQQYQPRDPKSNLLPFFFSFLRNFYSGIKVCKIYIKFFLQGLDQILIWNLFGKFTHKPRSPITNLTIWYTFPKSHEFVNYRFKLNAFQFEQTDCWSKRYGQFSYSYLGVKDFYTRSKNN